MAARDYANTRYSGLDQITPANVASSAGVHLLDRRAARPRSRADRRQQHDVHRRAVSEPVFALDLTKPGAPVKWKFDPSRAPARRAWPAATWSTAARVRRRQNLLQHAGWPDHRARRGHRQGAVAHQAGQHRERRDHDHGAAGRQGQGPGRQQRRRAGRARLADGARRQHRQDRLARLQHRPRQGRADRPELQALLQAGPRQGPGRISWPGDAWKIGGGTVWGFLSYDPEADLVYYGTGNPGPWNPEQRPGDNKWTSGMFARRPDTGEARWYYQSARTTCTTTTASTRTSWSTCRSAA
jgi:hypothetical protein